MFTRMAKPSPEVAARLAGTVLDERTRRVQQGGNSDQEGSRGSTSEDSGMSYGGRARQPKKKRSKAPTRFQSYYPWRG